MTDLARGVLAALLSAGIVWVCTDHWHILEQSRPLQLSLTIRCRGILIINQEHRPPLCFSLGG